MNKSSIKVAPLTIVNPWKIISSNMKMNNFLSQISNFMIPMNLEMIKSTKLNKNSWNLVTQSFNHLT